MLTLAPDSRRGPRSPLLNAKQAAEWFGVHVDTLRNWRRRRRGPRYAKLSRGVLRYRLADLEAFLESKLAPEGAK